MVKASIRINLLNIADKLKQIFMKRFLLFIPSVIILAAVILYSNPAELLTVISEANMFYIYLAFVFSFIATLLRVAKWWILLDGVSYSKLFPIQIFGMVFSNFTPGKVAEPAKTLLLKMRSGLNVSKTLPTIIWERIFDLIVLIFLAISALLFFGLSGFAQIGLAAIAIFSVLIAVLIFAMKNKAFGMKLFNIARKLPILKRISKKFVEAFYRTKMKNRRLVTSLFITIWPWILEGVILYFVLLAIGIQLNPIMLASLIALGDLIAIASFLPGGLGTFEVVSVLFLGVFGVQAATATAGIILYRFASFWFSAFIGAISFAYLSRKIDIKNILK